MLRDSVYFTTLKSLDYNVVMTFRFNNNNNNVYDVITRLLHRRPCDEVARLWLAAYDIITTCLTMTYPACRSQHCGSVETNEQTVARLSAQRDNVRRQRSCETLEQAYCRWAANRSRSHCRRITKTPGFRRSIISQA